MFGSDDQNIIGQAIDTLLASEVANITARFAQVKAILGSFPYNSADTAALTARYNALAPMVQRAQSEGPIEAEIDVQILKPEIDSLLADTQMFQSRQQAIGETYYQARPGAGGYYQPQSGYYYPSGSGPDSIERELKQYPVKGVAVPAWLWIAGGTILAIFFLSFFKGKKEQ